MPIVIFGGGITSVLGGPTNRDAFETNVKKPSVPSFQSMFPQS